MVKFWLISLFCVSRCWQNSNTGWRLPCESGEGVKSTDPAEWYFPCKCPECGVGYRSRGWRCLHGGSCSACSLRPHASWPATSWSPSHPAQAAVLEELCLEAPPAIRALPPSGPSWAPSKTLCQGCSVPGPWTLLGPRLWDTGLTGDEYANN